MLAVIAAMEKEADVLVRASAAEKPYTLYGKTLVRAAYEGVPYLLIRSGVGKSNAAAAAMLALSLGADRILNIGVAGGLVPKAKIGTVLQIVRAVQFDFDLSMINHTPVGTLDEYTSPYFPFQKRTDRFASATLASADRFGCGRDDERVLRSLGAEVRDMEGAAVAHVAFAANVPCFAFKAISDNAGENSPREYSENLQTALSALAGCMHDIFREVCDE